MERRAGAKIPMWTGGHTNQPSVDAPWLLKFISVLAILSIVGAILYVVAVSIDSSDVASLTDEEAIYVAVLHFVMPITVVYTVTTNSRFSRILILVYFATLYVATLNGKGFLGTLKVDVYLKETIATAVLVAIILWLFVSPKMRFYYAVISGKSIPPDLEARAAVFMDESKLNPKVRTVLDWVADHIESLALLGFSVLAVYACVSMV